MKLRKPKSFEARQSMGAISWNFIGMAFSLLIGVITARILSPDDRGLLALFLIISSVSYLLSSIGTHTAIRTFQPKESWASFRTYFQVSGVLFLINLLISFAVVLTYSHFAAVKIFAFSLHVVLLSSFNFISSQLLDVLNAVGKITLSAFANNIGHFSTLAGLLTLLFFKDYQDIRGVTAAYIFGFIVRILLICTLLYKNSVEIGDSHSGGRRRLIKAGLSFWGMGLGQTLTFRSDQLLLGYLSSPREVGLYAVATTPASLMRVISNSVAQVAFRLAALETLKARKLLKLLAVSNGITAIYVLILWILAPVLIPFVFGSQYAESAEIVRVLLIGELFLSPYLVLVRVLAGWNKPFFSSGSGVVGLVVIIPTMFLLVPIYGTIGAALSTIFSFASMLIFVVIGVVIYYRHSVLV